jgi:methionyl aminopeptidase
MSVSIKSAREIDLMRAGGKILAKVHEELAKAVKEGTATWEIDRLGEEMILSFGCIPSFKNYNGYPASVCISVNDEVVHGIPNKKRLLREGDIVSLDIGVRYKGYHTDAARTYGVGEISQDATLLIERTRQCFYEGIQFAKSGGRLHDISNSIAAYAEKFGYGVVRDLVGHGVGTQLHEDPQIPNYHQSNRGMKLRPGMTLAIEPMINEGRSDVEWLEDNWTVVTQDGSLSAHYENTVLITPSGAEILTLTESERASL